MAPLALGVADGPLERHLHLVPVDPGLFGVRGHSRLYRRRSGGGEAPGLELGPGGTFEGEKIVSEFDCHDRILRQQYAYLS